MPVAARASFVATLMVSTVAPPVPADQVVEEGLQGLSRRYLKKSSARMLTEFSSDWPLDRL